MKALAVCTKGLEQVTQDELKEYGIDSTVESGVALFDAELDKLLEFCYMAQSIHKLIILLDAKKIKGVEDIEKIKLKHKFIDGAKTFAVRCRRVGSHDFDSKEVVMTLGNLIDKKVDLENPDITIFAYVHENMLYVGIDLSGFELGKRDYKVFNHPTTIKGPLGYCLLDIAGYKPKDVMLDPFCGSGTIVIEAALKDSHTSPHYFKKNDFAFTKFAEFDFEKCDKKRKEMLFPITGYDASMNYVKYAEKNAKIAGIKKCLNLSRVEVYDLELKQKENSIEKIIAYPPFESKAHSLRDIEKIYEDFFYNAEFIMKKKGTMTLLARSPELLKKYAAKFKLKLKKELPLRVGDDDYQILIFEK